MELSLLSRYFVKANAPTVKNTNQGAILEERD